MAENNPVELDCELLNETPKAFHLEIMLTTKKKKKMWMPKSQVEVNGTRKGTKVIVPYWLAEKEGLL